MRAALVGLLIAALTGCASAPPPVEVKEQIAPVVEVVQPKLEYVQTSGWPSRRDLPPISIAAVGDIMMGSDFPTKRLPADDGASTFVAVQPVLASADVTIGNLEGVLQDGGEPFKVCKNPKLCYLFRTPGRYASHLRDAGFDIMSLANNHARDFGEEGRDATMANLDAVGIAHSGRVGDIASINVNGYQLGFIGFAPNPGSHSVLEIAAAAQIVARLATKNDFIVVSFHGGAEGLDALNVPFGNETYYGEDRGDLRAFSRAVIDAGADLVLGHGPHVVRGMEIYKDRLIAYSLGNFATYFGISVAGIKGIAPILHVVLDSEGRFLNGQLVSTRQTRADGLTLDLSEEAARLIQRLSKEDFGDNAPVFSSGGRIESPQTANEQ